MGKIINIWEYFSGKKTVMAAILKAVADVLTVMGQPEIAALADQAGNALLMLGLTHKTIKGVSK